MHDDLSVLTLDGELVRHPPIELYPAVKLRVPAPEDVEELVSALARSRE